jgi:ABC-type multidrug transport system fused ATPase/permease subunit
VSVGLLVAFIQYIQRVFVPVRELSAKVATIERAFAALERIFGLLDTDERLPAGSHAPTSVRGDLDLDHLDFSYDGKHRVLHDVCLHVEAGQVLALVGPTGSGKSTIGKLLTRLYAAPQGSVRVDGVAVEQWQPQALRRAIGVVQQDVVLFAASLRDNVDLGRGLDDAVIQRALEDACLGDLVQRLGGLHAQPGEGGTGLSAGERQLLSIARVLAANPAVVVLDEATSSIDSLTEQKVQAAIARVLHGRTAVVVAHRLSTVRQAQQIAVLERGRVVACGNHEALMAEDGLYAGLVQAAERQGHLA